MLRVEAENCVNATRQELAFVKEVHNAVSLFYQPLENTPVVECDDYSKITRNCSLLYCRSPLCPYFVHSFIRLENI